MIVKSGSMLNHSFFSCFCLKLGVFSMKTHLISNRSRRRTHGLALILILLSLGIIYLLSSEMVSITGMVTVLDIAQQGFEFKDPGNISKGAVESEFNSVKQKI